MKNKNIFALLLLTLPLLFTSCLKDQDDVFDGSSTQRMEEYLANAKKVLCTPEKGWVMDYYVGDNQKTGGFAYLVKFDDKKVTAMSELTGDVSATSYYKLTTDNGASLTFDTNNEVLHKLATPSAESYEGSHADFEFIIMSVEPDLVVLKGKKTGSLMSLHPLTMDPKEYLSKVKAMADSVCVGTALGKIGNTNISATFDMDTRQASFVCPDDTSKHAACAFTFTDKGIRLYKTVTFAEKPFSAYTYDGANEKLYCSDADNTDFVMNCYKPDSWKAFEDLTGDYWWRFYYSVEQSNGKTAKYMDSIQVKITGDADGSNYTVKGLASAFDLKLKYNRSKGALEFNPQQIGTYGSFKAYVCGLDKDGGYLSYSSEIGVIFTWNKDSERPIFAGTPKESDALRAYGMILWLISDSGYANFKEIVSPWLSGAGSGYLMSGRYNLLEGPMSLVKINN